MKRLTPCELEMMQVIWKCEGDIQEMDIKAQLSQRFGKEYARTTISTFLKKLGDKGYLEKYRVGRNSYVRVLIPASVYIRCELQHILKEYYGGDMESFLNDVRSLA